MERILICPGERPGVGFLAQTVPLVAVPLLGENVLTYWMVALAGAGVKEVLVHATDRPEMVRSVVGDGSRWGLRIRYAYEGITPLETGGGMLNALPLLGSAPFIAVNGDIWCDVDFTALLAEPAEVAEVLADLGRRDTEESAQLLRADDVPPLHF